MRILNKLLITLFLVLSFNAMASNVESVTLINDSLISGKNITAAHLNFDKSVDFIELNDGSRIEGSEIKNISFTAKSFFRLQVRGAVRTGGDGSGG